MGASLIPCVVMTVLWGIVGIVLPFLAPKGPSRGDGKGNYVSCEVPERAIGSVLKMTIIQVSLILTGVTCWLFWLCAYMAQMNPLIGPKLRNTTILMMAKQWGNPIEE